ncbi:sulfurtransferase [Alteromonas sp. ASW11-130]|uniref:sulfurtransferase n=1 Tax=Alteromonas sp. ASW11-130 TaxID=3015775 RepID=UPI002241878A|nr:sulfurtransferase [Alteromonas sp. ASW11-130]MCW8092378.1 sulfurtransferase [Alteromonas sp. ASW11-130]
MNPFLIDPEQLNDELFSTRVVVLRAEMRDPFGDAEKIENHDYLPQARNFNLDGQGSDRNSSLPHTLPSIDQLSHYLGSLGVALTTPVVVYDDKGIFSSARVWWMLKSLGHESVRVLNGGLPAWKDLGLTLNAEPASPGRNRLYEANAQPNWFVDKSTVLEAISGPIQIIDARSSERFFGKTKEPRDGVVSGHVPGAKNLPFSRVLEDNRFKETVALRQEFTKAEIDLSSPLIVLCGSGVTACIVGMAALMCGANAVSVYDGSWTEWGSCEECPVEAVGG